LVVMTASAKTVAAGSDDGPHWQPEPGTAAPAARRGRWHELVICPLA
jgi:hypothetical protein